MANFTYTISTDEIKEIEKILNNSEKMFGEMTKAGADVVLEIVKSNMKAVFKNSSELEKFLTVSKTYKTPSDDGINNKVIFSGYMINQSGKSVPVPLVVAAREYGTSHGEEKKPFFRKSFKKPKIEDAMKKVERKYLGGVDE